MNIVVPLRKSRLQEIREAEKANLRIDVFTEGELQFSETFPMEVLPYNHWYPHPTHPETIACFVQPNSEAIEKIISLVRDRLQRESRETELNGYQTGDPAKVIEMLEALYHVMQQDLRITYINPPPSFELQGQKIFLPEQIYEHRRGTCLDLTLLCAACVERMGLNPLCFLIKGHAFFGAWLDAKNLREPVLRDSASVAELVSQGLWFPLNSTTFASSSQKGFRACHEEGLFFLSKAEDFEYAVDVYSARRSGIKPLPPLLPDR
jgi:hypothetical protein